mgnify:CR=1 FL=1
MSELQQRVERLMLRLDRMGMRVEQAVADAIQAAERGNVKAGETIDETDSVIDREEVEIEQECIRLLALYQPTAIDLRTICTVIKVNNDLERIADLATSIGRRVKHIVEDEVDLLAVSGYQQLREDTLSILGRTIRMLNTTDATTAGRIIGLDNRVDEDHKELVHGVLANHGGPTGNAEFVMTVISVAKALERIADLCTNIAEDIVFLRTGDVVRHADAFEESQGEPSART